MPREAALKFRKLKKNEGKLVIGMLSLNYQINIFEKSSTAAQYSEPITFGSIKTEAIIWTLSQALQTFRTQEFLLKPLPFDLHGQKLLNLSIFWKECSRSPLFTTNFFFFKA